MITLSGDKRDGKYYLNGNRLRHENSLKIANHSPDGFNHGYMGSGCSQLALAILLELTDEQTAKDNYVQFKIDVIANLKEEHFYVLIDDSKYSETISTEDPFFGKIITDRDVYVYREIYYETFKREIVTMGITHKILDEKIKEACEKFGWTIKKYNTFRSIDGMQRIAKMREKNKETKKMASPIYDVMEFPRLQCPIRTEDKSTL